MRILIMAESLGGPGGIQRSTLFIARDLAGKGHQVSLVYGQDGELSDAWHDIAPRRLGLGSVQLPRRAPVLSIRRRALAVRFARSAQAQIVYCHSMNQLPLATFIGRKLGIPIVFHLRTAPSVDSRRNRKRMLSPAHFIAVSESTRSSWARLRSDLCSVCDVIPNGVDLAHFAPVSEAKRRQQRELLGLPAEGPVAVFVGRFAEEKGVLDLIRAHRQVPRDSRPWLVLAGAPVSRDDDAYAEVVRQEAGERTLFLGNRSDVAAVIWAGDVVVVPSHTEQASRVVIESLACDVPVIGTEVGGIAEILGREFRHSLCRPGDVAGLTQLLQAATEPDSLVRGTGVCRTVAERYDLRHCNDRIERLLLDVVDRRH